MRKFILLASAVLVSTITASDYFEESQAELYESAGVVSTSLANAWKPVKWEYRIQKPYDIELS